MFEEPPKVPPREADNRSEVKKPRLKKDVPIRTSKAKEKAEQKKELAILTPGIREHLRIAILIDDIGQDMEALHELLAIDAPLSFAVLPHQRHSEEAAQTLFLKNRDILLHMPMEPKSYPAVNPGKGALLTTMSDEDIRNQFRKNLQNVPYVQGVNNHMGSCFTANEEKMFVVMQELKKQGLYFVDSRTTADTKARELAVRIGVPFGERNVFIDNDQTYEASRKNLMQVLDNPYHFPEGELLMIGHPYPSTIAAIRDAVPLLRAKGVEIVPVSRVIGQ
ncbi:MAG: divergent polysaccharide deacetylase family protein [Syntrophaceae bacterium]|nr:divergent polysaccharide deacetylase family protein [Syntrophaceae bacterium]